LIYLKEKGELKRNKMVKKKKMGEVRSLIEASAIKRELDKLNKKLGIRHKATIKRTPNLKYAIYN